ncbi:MAG TPA: amino acid ABC transporter permease [Burkholderiaceae bacterium]|nr:amino acid ABC transporter permease [Burkholderiaceae bacterium]
MTGFELFVDGFLNGAVAVEWTPAILKGFVLTVFLAVLVVLTGLGAGLLLSLVRSLGFRFLNAVIVFVVDILRTIPALVLIVLLYFGAPSIGVVMSGSVSTWLALSLVLMAFSEEIFWAGITSISKGQWEAARSTGLGFGRTFFHIILPQAIRLTIPPLTNRTIGITKGIALASVVAVQDILGSAQTAVTFAFNATPLLIAAAAYIILFLPLVILSRRIETRFHWRR